ncbi:MAG: matrixin family metalloprotease [Phycisphaerales bacterium]
MFTTALISIVLGAGGAEASTPPAPPACSEQLHPLFDPGRGSGMIGDGWDGPGQNAVTIYFHMDNATNALGPSQRQVLLDALAAWAGVVQIHFVELAVQNASRSIDFLWATGDHCALEPHECGNDLCWFNGPEFGAIAHAFYPPGISNICGGVSVEPTAGNVHFDAQESFFTDPSSGGYSLMLTAVHNIGHALGLQDSENPGDHDVMGPIEWNEQFIKISQTDALQIQQGYSAGVGSVTPLEVSGVWVNGNWNGQELGTPGSPFNTLEEGVAGVPPFGGGVVVHVQAGLYPGGHVVATPCVIQSEFGTAYIGQ